MIPTWVKTSDELQELARHHGFVEATIVGDIAGLPPKFERTCIWSNPENLDAAAGRSKHAPEQLQETRLPGPFGTDDAEDFSGPELEVHVA